MLYLKPINGLCNRIRAISAAIKLAGSVGQKPCVVWAKQGRDMNVGFKELFLVPDEFFIVDADDLESEALFANFSPSNPHYVSQAQMAKPQEREAFVKRFLASPNEDWYLETHEEFVHDLTYTWIKPLPLIAEEIDRVVANMPANCIGVHIRRTDNAPSMIYSPDQLFKDKIREELAHNSEAKFFVASDDGVIKRELVQEFGTAIITRQNLASRSQNDGVAQGLVDLMLLSKTRKIYASYWSSFSVYAARIGGIQAICLKDDNVEATLQRAVKLCGTLTWRLLQMKQKYNELHDAVSQVLGARPKVVCD